MTRKLKILVGQLNPVVGDIDGNLALARQAYEESKARGADLLVLSELFITGYPAEDLLLKPGAVALSMAAIAQLAKETNGGPAIAIGAPWCEGNQLYNSALLLKDGHIDGRYDKRELPNYSVFDEKRIFKPGMGDVPLFSIKGVRFALAVCEDLWTASVPQAVKAAGGDLLVGLNASPWRQTVESERASAFSHWNDLDLPFLFVNQVGGQDELVFDGASFATNSGYDKRDMLIGQFRTGTALLTFSDKRFAGLRGGGHERDGRDSSYRAAMMALGDYVRKNNFPGVIIGLSGGIDSALTAALAVDALGADKVWCVMLPGQYTSQDSLEDARACAQALGVRYDVMDIGPGVAAFDHMLAPQFSRCAIDTSEENIQSRLRGMMLMALSNKFGHMLITTGNKSEMAVGYATLYGDMCGGYNPLKDFYKTEVVELSQWRNTTCPKGALGPDHPVIPQRILTKPPSAELRHDQKDEDSLPPYPVLDDILRGLVDNEERVSDIIARGHDAQTVRHIEDLLYRAEYKRRQAAPGVKIGGRNFGRDRRYPVTNRFRDRPMPQR